MGHAAAIVHGYATPDPYPPMGYEFGEWCAFHTERHDDTSVAVTILSPQGQPLRAHPRLAYYDVPAGPEYVPPLPDPTLGGRIVKHNGVAVQP